MNSGSGSAEARTAANAPRARWIALWLVASVALLWPAVVNGGAFWFPDTGAYIRGADAAFVTVTGSPSEWSDRIVIPGSESDQSAPSTNAAQGTEEGLSGPTPIDGKMIISGRSIYYGFLIYFPIRLAGPWFAIGLQAALVSASLVFTLAVATRGMVRRRLSLASATIGALIILTPIGFYTCMLMPDIWSGICAAMIALLASKTSVMRKREMFFAWILAAAAATFHSSHVLLAFGVGAAGALLAPSWLARGSGLVAGISAAAVGLLSTAMFNWAVEAQLGQAPISPPFLSARLTDSGPGLAFLDAHCPTAPEVEKYALCDVRGRLPQKSDRFLWSELESDGVFQIAPDAIQRSIAEQDKKFYLSVVFHDPVAYGQSFALATFETLTSFNMINFNYYRERGEAIGTNYPKAIAEDAMKTKAVANTMPTSFTLNASIAVSVLSAAFILWNVWQAARSGQWFTGSAQRFALLLIAGLLANAVICGALSKPDARYQMRLQWLLPLAAVSLFIGREVSDRRLDSAD